MTWTIPTESAAHNVHQAEWDKKHLDWVQEAAKGNGVMTGCAVTAQGTPDMTVAVAAGSVRTSDLLTHQVSAGNGTISAADSTNPRLDVVVATQSGSIAVRAGTANAAPVLPSLTSGDVPLAVVYVEANETAIESTMISDARMFPVGYAHMVKSSDESITNDITLTDDADLTFYAEANETWLVVGKLFMEAAGNGADMRAGVTAPAGADVDYGAQYPESADTDGLNHNVGFDATQDVIMGIPATNNAVIHVAYMVEVAGTAGDIAFQWAAFGNVADALTMKAGSFLEAFRID